MSNWTYNDLPRTHKEARKIIRTWDPGRTVKPWAEIGFNGKCKAPGHGAGSPGGYCGVCIQDIHSCHNECPCHTGGKLLDDFAGGI